MPEVRVIGAQGEQLGVMMTPKAVELAVQNELDLVEVAPTAQPPVCRVMDFSKYKYDQEKKERQSKKHQRLSHLKEIRFKPNIEEHDYLTKLHHLVEFLKKGDRVKVVMVFRGREMSHQELGRQIIDRLLVDCASSGQVEKAPALEGRMIVSVVVPK